MSDISDNIIKILNDNGVSVQIENIWGSTGTDPKVVRRNINLDFSEHDKVFEDKIASLEKKIEYIRGRKAYLRTRCMEDVIDAFDGGSYGALTIVGRRVDLEKENEKLKQRIAELESENEQLKHDIDKMATSKSEWIDKAVEWQQKCEELEGKKAKKPTKSHAVIIAKEINGQTYVTLDDFMSVVNDLQAEIGT